MNQKALLIGLGVGVLGILLGAALLLPMTSSPIAPDNTQENLPATAADEVPEGFRVDGEDEHGRYMLGADDQRIYVDSEGRRYIFGPDGERIFIDGKGRYYVIDADGKRRYVGKDGKPVAGSGNASGHAEETTNPSETRPEEDDTRPDETKPASLSGQVVDDHGTPYEGATVVATPTGAESMTANTDEEGSFAFADLPAGVPLLLAAKDKYGNTSKSHQTRLAIGPNKLPGALVLPRDTAIRGVVRNAETGLPVAEAAVWLLGAGNKYGHGHQTTASMSTGPGGAFVFDKLPPQGYRLQITRDGFAPRILNNVMPPEDLVIEMSPGAVITGTVSDETGAAISGAVISCDFRAEPAQYFHTEAVTDEAGFYAVKCQPESQHNTLTVIAPGYSSDTRTLVKSGSENVNFALQPSGNVVLRGRLLTMGGQPVTAATFRVYGPDGKYRKLVQSVGPDSDGIFRAEAEPAATKLTASGSGLADISAEFEPVAGEEIDLGDLYMDAGYAVYGVVHEQGNPELLISGAEVRVGVIKTTTDANGAYRLEGIGTSQFIVGVLHPAFLGTAVSVNATDYETELNLELRTASFEARVVVKDDATGAPIDGVIVEVIDYAQQHLTDNEGAAHLTGLSSLSVNVRFSKTGYATLEIQINAGLPDDVNAAPPQEVLLPRGAMISGACTTTGVPLPGGTEVEIWNTSNLVATVLTDTEGRYETESLPAGEYFVGLPQHHWAARAVTVGEEGVEFDIEIGVVCHMRGKLTRSDGQPHANAGIYIYRRDDVYWRATIHTDPAGYYEIENLHPGEWVFCALKTQGDTAAQFAVPVTVSTAGWTDKDVQLPQITGVMTGRVTYPDGAPVKRARVAVTNLSANFDRALLAAYVVTDDNGYYTASRLENGAQMQARVGGYQDEAQTGTSFSEVKTIPVDDSPVEADIVVAREGVTVRVHFHRPDNGPFLSGGPLGYLFDDQGRMSGLFFGSNWFNGHVNVYDVIPGTYTLVITNAGMKRTEFQFTAGTENIMTGLEVTIEPIDRSNE